MDIAEGGNGAFCGTSLECPASIVNPDTGMEEGNPDWGTCVHGQCDSNFCLLSGAQGVYLNIPVCTQPCEIYLDEVNNYTEAPGGDGIEDANAPLTDCSGFADGPGSDNYVCVNFAPPEEAPAAYCLPGTTFHECDSDADCAATEQCLFTTIGGLFVDRCVARIQDTGEVLAAKMGEGCDQYSTPGPLTYCESGWCFGIGCVSYCSDDAHCDTTKLFPGTGCDTGTGTCKAWPAKGCAQDSDCSHWECSLLDVQIFDNLPEYTADLCWPKTTGCMLDTECPDGTYCRWSWTSALDPQTGLPVWENYCADKVDGGVPLGGECGVDGPTCENDDFCFNGHCSALCEDAADCADDQFCVVNEFMLDVDGDDVNEQSIALEWCMTFEGSLTPCFSDATCGAGERCELHEYESRVNDPDNPGSTILDPDGPYLVQGLCVTAGNGLAGLGETCLWGSDCSSGWCLGSDPDSGDTGFCSALCEDADDCGAMEMNGEMYPGFCNGYMYLYGGDSGIPETNIHIGLCGFTAGSGEDCTGDFTCPWGEACSPRTITFGPDYAANIDYRCLSNTNWDDSLPTKQLGESCDPWAEDQDGNPLTQCISGLCFQGTQWDNGYCAAPCSKAADTCAADSGDPTMACFDLTPIPRWGKYTGNSATWSACMKDTDCTPCDHAGDCPGERSCVNLGQNDDLLADYRCVQACSENVDCASATAPTCNTSTNGFGQPTKGCFEQLTFPVNHCI